MTGLSFSLVAAVLVASTALADDIRTERVKFHKAANSTTLQGTLPANCDYKVRLYLVRNAARRDEVAKYRLEMVIV